MAKFVIDRSKWRCGGEGSYGGGSGPTKLLNNEGFMCCLGQVSCQLGVPEDEIRGLEYPRHLARRKPQFREQIELLYAGFDETPLSRGAYQINDNTLLTDEEREESLIEHFREHGHEIEFTGEFATA